MSTCTNNEDLLEDLGAFGSESEEEESEVEESDEDESEGLTNNPPVLDSTKESQPPVDDGQQGRGRGGQQGRGRGGQRRVGKGNDKATATTGRLTRSGVSMSTRSAVNKSNSGSDGKGAPTAKGRVQPDEENIENEKRRAATGAPRVTGGTGARSRGLRSSSNKRDQVFDVEGGDEKSGEEVAPTGVKEAYNDETTTVDNVNESGENLNREKEESDTDNAVAEALDFETPSKGASSNGPGLDNAPATNSREGNDLFGTPSESNRGPSQDPAEEERNQRVKRILERLNSKAGDDEGFGDTMEDSVRREMNADERGDTPGGSPNEPNVVNSELNSLLDAFKDFMKADSVLMQNVRNALGVDLQKEFVGAFVEVMGSAIDPVLQKFHRRCVHSDERYDDMRYEFAGFRAFHKEKLERAGTKRVFQQKMDQILLDTVLESVEGGHKEEVDALINDHNEAVRTLDKRVSKAEANHKKAFEELEKKHKGEIDKLAAEHAKKLRAYQMDWKMVEEFAKRKKEELAEEEKEAREGGAEVSDVDEEGSTVSLP